MIWKMYLCYASYNMGSNIAQSIRNLTHETISIHFDKVIKPDNFLQILLVTFFSFYGIFKHRQTKT